MKKLLLLLATSFFLQTAVLGQDAIFSLSDFNPIGLNPAFALPSNGELFVASNSRQQWWNLPGPNATSSAYHMNQFSALAPFLSQKKKGLGGGVQFFRSSAGAGKLSLSEFTFTGASRVDQPMKVFGRRMNVHMGVGVGVGFKQFSLDWSNLVFASQLDPFYGLISSVPLVNPQATATAIAPVANVGVKFKSTFKSDNRTVKSWQWGAAIYQVNKPGLSFFDENTLLQRRINAHASWTLIPANRRGLIGGINSTYYTVSHRFYHQFPAFTNETTFGVNMNSILTLNTGFRRKQLISTNDRVDALVVGVELSTGGMMLGVSYDFTISTLNVMRSGGTSEISLIVPLSAGRKIRAKRASEPCFADYLLSHSEWKSVERFNSESKFWGREYSPITFEL